MNLKLEEFTKWKNITSREKNNFLSENVKNSNTIMDHWTLRTNIVSWNNYIKSHDPFSYLSEHLR